MNLAEPPTEREMLLMDSFRQELEALKRRMIMSSIITYLGGFLGGAAAMQWWLL